MTSEKRMLSRARKTLRNIEGYCALQVVLANRNVITPGNTWRKAHADVNGIVAKWAKEALKESRRC